MNFFKSVFSDDTDPSDSPNSQSPSKSEKDQQEHDEHASLGDDDDHNPDHTPNSSATLGGVWSFGGLIQTLASRSESVIQTYRRDLEEFGSGLKKETAVIREVASRAVKDLPTSFEVGASVAQESLESVGQAIDEFGTTVWKETTEIIAQGKDAILSVDQDTDSSSDNNSSSSSNQQLSDRGLDSKRYSRFDAQLHAIQCDSNTYCEEPEDLDDYSKWRSGFVISEKREEIEGLIEDNGVMEGAYRNLVPSNVDFESFWSRYFYKAYKLKQTEEARAKLVKRAILGEEEDLSWDFDDDDDEDEEIKRFESKGDVVGKDASHIAMKNKDDVEDSQVGTAGSGEKSLQIENDGKGIVIESIKDNVADDKVKSEGQSDFSEVKTDKTEGISDEKMGSEGKTDNGESCKDSDFSVVSSQPSFPEEEDLGWDEIEDIESNDESKVAVGGSPNKIGLRKRLSTAEEEEDLSWDIEDDDEPLLNCE